MMVSNTITVRDFSPVKTFNSIVHESERFTHNGERFYYHKSTNRVYDGDNNWVAMGKDEFIALGNDVEYLDWN